MKLYLLPCDQDRYRARPHVRRPTSIRSIGALFLSLFSMPLARVVFASLFGGDNGGTYYEEIVVRLMISVAHYHLFSTLSLTTAVRAINALSTLW